MKNSEQPINPCMMQQVGDDSYRAHKEGDPKGYRIPMAGLTKREYFAGLAMQGLLVNYVNNGQYASYTDQPDVAHIAVQVADELLKQLENN